MDELKIGTEHYRWVPLYTFQKDIVLRYYVTTGRFAIVVGSVPQASFERGRLEELMDVLEEPQ